MRMMVMRIVMMKLYNNDSGDDAAGDYVRPDLFKPMKLLKSKRFLQAKETRCFPK